MRPRRVREQDDGAIDITPMIDIVFIMLIFFVVTASFVKEPGTQVERPEAKSATLRQRASILLAIDPIGQVWIDKRPIDVRAVRPSIERLRAENPEGDVVIQADTTSKNAVLVKVVDAVKAAGVDNIILSAEAGQ